MWCHDCLKFITWISNNGTVKAEACSCLSIVCCLAALFWCDWGYKQPHFSKSMILSGCAVSHFGQPSIYLIAIIHVSANVLSKTGMKPYTRGTTEVEVHPYFVCLHFNMRGSEQVTNKAQNPPVGRLRERWESIMKPLQSSNRWLCQSYVRCGWIWIFVWLP